MTYASVYLKFLIHEADPQSRSIVIIVFAHVVRPSVRPHFSKQNKFQAKAMIANGETVGLAEWIIDDTCLVFISFPNTNCGPMNGGTCYTSEECNLRGGRSSGGCANGFGICCVSK